MPDLVLSPLVSYRCLDELTIVVDHRRGELLRLNPAAGRIVEKLDRAAAELTREELEFVALLGERGLVDGIAAPGEERAAPGSTAPAASPATPPPDEAERRALIDRLNDHAAAHLVPLHAQLELTYRCPLACSFCYLHSERPAPTDELSTRELQELLDELAELGSLFLLLTGGEIFLRPDLEAVVAHARRRRFAVSLLTSGCGVDRSALTTMAAAGLDCVQISLHGPDAATHDGLTGVEGSFAAALGALRFVRSLGVRAQAAITVTRHNLASLPALLELCRQGDITPNVARYVEPERSGSRRPQAALLDEAGLAQTHDLLPPDGPARLAGRGPDDRPCGAGASTVAIDPHGTVFPCHTLRIPVGSIRRTPLRRLWADARELKRIRSIRVADLEDCPSCDHRSTCNRCAGFAVAEGRGPTGHSPFDCLEARVLASKGE